jgi:hypothetical protein
MYKLWLAENTLQSGNTLANPTTPTAFASACSIIWANSDSGANAIRNFTLKAYGTVTFGAAATLSLTLKIGSTVLATLTTPSSGGALGPVPFVIDGTVQINSSGPSGSMIAQMILMVLNGSPYLNVGAINTSNTTVNTQNAASLSISASFSVSNSSNSITLANPFEIVEL